VAGQDLLQQVRGALALALEVRATSVTYSEESEVSTERSVRITGMPAALASLSTASQPVTTTGEKEMTSTFWRL